MSLPSLYVFTISHYCEKARWALDYLEVDYQLRVVAPGSHLKIAQKLGLKRGSVPFLKTEDSVIQGSDAIIDWAERQTSSDKSLGSNDDKVIAIEQRLDNTLGVHSRRWFYSEAIVEHAATVRPGYQQGLESLQIIKTEIDWLEELITDKHSFLVDNKLSRADITAASLLAPIITPNEHGSANLIVLPPRLQDQYSQMSDSKVWPWVSELYFKYRA